MAPPSAAVASAPLLSAPVRRLLLRRGARAAEDPAQDVLVDAVAASAGQGGVGVGGQSRPGAEVAVRGTAVGEVMSSGAAAAQIGWNSGIVSRTSPGVRRVKCCQMRMREESIASRRSTVWQPSPPTRRASTLGPSTTTTPRL